MAVSLRPGMSLSGSCYDNGLETQKKSSVFPLDQSMALKTELKGRQVAVIDDRNQVTSLIFFFFFFMFLSYVYVVTESEENVYLCSKSSKMVGENYIIKHDRDKVCTRTC